MTNSYNSSPTPKIVFFHGLNNNPECMEPVIAHFRSQGLETELVILPCHGENRKEARNFTEAQLVFDQKMEKYCDVPYVAVAFSQGALYLQLWMDRNQDKRPLKQILLAPALFIRNQKIVEKALRVLPDFFLIKSLSPRHVRRFSILTAGEYKMLLEGVLKWQETKKPFHVPTMVLIDPRDELVDARTLKTELERTNKEFEVHLLHREMIKWVPGFHHIIFHPDYFRKDDWKIFTSKLESFLGINVEV